jgi:hypothetical protein
MDPTEAMRKPTMVQDMLDNKDKEFLQLTGLEDMDEEPLELAMDKIDMSTFDAQHFESVINTEATGAAVPFLFYKIF